MLLTFMRVLPLALVTTSLRLLVHFRNLLCERGRGWQADLSNRGVRLPRVSCLGDNFASMLSVFNMWLFSEVPNNRSCD